MPEASDARKEDPEFWGRPRSEGTRFVLAVAGLLLVLAILLVIFSFVWIFVNQTRIETVTGEYFRALGRGDGASAYKLLCEEVRDRTSEAELSALLPDNLRPVSVSGFTRSTGPRNVLPWSQDGLAWVNLKMGESASQPHVEMRNEGGWLFDNGWKVCPTGSLDGRGR